MNSAELEKNLNEIKTELERAVDPLSISQVQDKLMKLTNYTGLSAECLKWARQNVLFAQSKIINANREDNLTAMLLKMKIEGDLWQELSVFTYAERLNAAITHAIDALRTVISLYKSEMENTLKSN